MASLPHQLPAHVARSRSRVHVVVETPKGSRSKVAFDLRLAAFKRKSALPEGHSLPYDFDFVPSTKAAAGDPPEAKHSFRTYPYKEINFLVISLLCPMHAKRAHHLLTQALS